MAKSSKTSKASGARKKKAGTSGRGASSRTKKKTAAKKTASKKAVPKKKAAKKKAASKKTTTKKPATKTAAAKKIAKKAAPKKKAADKATKKPKATIPAKTAKKAKATPAKKTGRTTRPAKRLPTKTYGRAAATVDANAPVNGSLNGEMSLTELSESQLRRAKSGLKKKDLEYFRDELLERRAEILGDVANLDAARDNFGGEISNMPLHMADVGSENYDREFNLGLLESEKKLLREIDEALLRIPNKTYGICHVTGQPIERARLEIKPWAKYCIEVVRERERRGLPT